MNKGLARTMGKVGRLCQEFSNLTASRHPSDLVKLWRPSTRHSLKDRPSARGFVSFKKCPVKTQSVGGAMSIWQIRSGKQESD